MTEPTEILVGKRADFADDGRRVVTFAGFDIGVLCHGGRFYAYENRCVHQGGPVCEGRVLGKVEAVLGKDKTLLHERFSRPRCISSALGTVTNTTWRPASASSTGGVGYDAST